MPAPSDAELHAVGRTTPFGPSRKATRVTRRAQVLRSASRAHGESPGPLLERELQAEGEADVHAADDALPERLHAATGAEMQRLDDGDEERGLERGL